MPHSVLAVDEVGYLSYDARCAYLLFEVVTRRYEQQRPVLLTTNKPFHEWNRVFPNDLPLVCLPLDLPPPATAELIDFLHQLTAAFERNYAAELHRH